MLQVGFGAADITHPVGAQMPGSFTSHKSKGVRDKLWAVACVVYDGTTPVALAGIDALFITRPRLLEAGLSHRGWASADNGHYGRAARKTV
jgi:hypothetical protein